MRSGIASIEGQLRHRVMLAIAGPKRCLVLDCRGGDECVGNFETVAAPVLVKQIACQLTCLVIGFNAIEKAKTGVDCLLLSRPRTLPDFRRGYWGKENSLFGSDQSRPFRQYGLVPRPENLNHNIGIKEYAHSIPRRFLRVSFLNPRT